MATYAGGSNAYVKSWDASGKLHVEFSRNPKSFAINDYCALRTVQKERGYYLKVTAEEAARVIDIADYAWPAGAAGNRPGGQTNDNKEEFQFSEFRCDRYKYDYPLDYLVVKQADFNVLALHGRVNAQKAMTLRTKVALDKLTSTANWGSNTGTATAVGGGVWTASSTTDQFILKTFLAVQLAINKATLGVVRPEHLRCVISPALARTIRQTPEIIDFVKQQGSAPAILGGNEFFSRWGVPQYLYGIKMVVEDAIGVNSRKIKGTDATKDYILGSGTAVFCAMTQDTNGETVRKPESGDGVPIFDTITNFLFEDMTIESRDNPGDRMIDARIVDHFGIEVTAPATGFLVTAAA